MKIVVSMENSLVLLQIIIEQNSIFDYLFSSSKLCHCLQMYSSQCDLPIKRHICYFSLEIKIFIYMLQSKKNPWGNICVSHFIKSDILIISILKNSYRTPTLFPCIIANCLIPIYLHRNIEVSFFLYFLVF